jgi:glutamate-1-semialdehyde 2,1-aminomutase
VQGVGAMFQVVFSADGSLIRQYRDTFNLDTRRYDVFRHALLKRGIHINASGLACWFLCSVLTDEDIDQACAAVHEAFAEIH